jgi:hypothetical protein
MTSKILRTAAAIAALMALALVPAFAATPQSPYVATVAATQANTTTTFSFDTAETVFISNDGANEIYVRWGAVAVAAATTNIQIPAYKSKSFTFAPGQGPGSVGIICSGGETATVRVEAYPAGVFAPGPGGVVEGGAASTVSGAQTIGSLATTTTMDVGTDLTVGGTAEVTGTLTQTGIATFTAAPVMSALTASRLVVTGAGKALASNGAITTSNVPKSASSGASLADSSISDNGTLVTITSEPLSVTGAYVKGLLLISVPQAQTVADDAGGTNAPATLLPTASVVLVTCNDAQGCDETFDETGAVSGTIVQVVNLSAVPVTFADTGGLSETVGALSLGQYDSVTFLYAGDRFVQMSAVVNN